MWKSSKFQLLKQLLDMDTKPKFTREITKDRRGIYACYKVHGFWPHDSVRVDMTTSFDDEWRAPFINWSCGGRDAKEEPDNLTAAECFAAAIKDAVKLARKWKKNPPKL